MMFQVLSQNQFGAGYRDYAVPQLRINEVQENYRLNHKYQVSGPFLL